MVLIYLLQKMLSQTIEGRAGGTSARAGGTNAAAPAAQGGRGEHEQASSGPQQSWQPADGSNNWGLAYIAIHVETRSAGILHGPRGA